MAEGLVALSTGTPTTTRGCLPVLISAMEMDVDSAQGILGLPNDDFTSIELLARKMTAQRPNSYTQVLNTLVCLPGLTSDQKTRIVEGLDGLQSNSKIAIKNMDETAAALSLINTNSYGVRATYGMVKLDLDLACLLSHLLKFGTTVFTAAPEALERPAQNWRDKLTGDYLASEGSSSDTSEELGAEIMFASLCSGKLPKLFQRIAESLGMSQALPPSSARSLHDRSEPQHNSRPWNLSQIGHFLTVIFYSGVTGRFARLMEALDLPHEYTADLKELFESEFGFFDIISWFPDYTDFLINTDEKEQLKKGSQVNQDTKKQSQ